MKWERSYAVLMLGVIALFAIAAVTAILLTGHKVPSELLAVVTGAVIGLAAVIEPSKIGGQADGEPPT